MRTHPVATALASAVADRALDRLAPQLDEEVRLRALLPADQIEERGREAVLARFDVWFRDHDTITLADVAGDEVGDRVLVHYKLLIDPDGEARVLSQTAVCSMRDGRVSRIDLVCSGYRELS